ncbi:MAG: hypothetical protein ACR2RV_14030, partial [Verrucomicrobiales bacterium]
MSRSFSILCLLLLATLAGPLVGATPEELEKEFVEKVQPFLSSYCFSCHGDEKSKGGINIQDYKTLSAV